MIPLPVQVKGGDFSVVTFEIREIEMIRQRLRLPREPANIQ